MPHPSFISYGFGYDESTDDYKVAGFSGKVGTSCFEVEGLLRGEGLKALLIVFLRMETHGEVLEPDYLDGRLHRRLLDVLNGCLCILCAYCDYFDLWVMKEYVMFEEHTAAGAEGDTAAENQKAQIMLQQMGGNDNVATDGRKKKNDRMVYNILGLLY
ncbi:hypothetical protein RHSIM_Rhsim02G0055700 [Rhododendron simsii]|uniref:Uncharacterized protein n=1 Tax=Rhododendron simsii TaxID=118357 RepID=A0A834HDW4_RHOSS|nr:hypothetical protein RHSIM_Rhsim02G0055700 [Rhododendron simsii]